MSDARARHDRRRRAEPRTHGASVERHVAADEARAAPAVVDRLDVHALARRARTAHAVTCVAVPRADDRHAALGDRRHPRRAAGQRGRPRSIGTSSDDSDERRQRFHHAPAT